MISKFKYISIVFVFLTGFSLSELTHSSHIKYLTPVINIPSHLRGAPRMVTLKQNVLAVPFG